MENHNHVEEIIHSFESGALEDFEIESFKELEIFSKILFDSIENKIDLELDTSLITPSSNLKDFFTKEDLITLCSIIALDFESYMENISFGHLVVLLRNEIFHEWRTRPEITTIKLNHYHDNLSDILLVDN